MSRKKTPPSYTEPGGPRIVETHSYRLSPFGPALQFGGGSRVISASSFWIRFVEVPNALLIFGFGLGSGFASFVVAEPPAPTAADDVELLPPTEPLVVEVPARLRLVPPLVPLELVLGPAVADIVPCINCDGRRAGREL